MPKELITYWDNVPPDTEEGFTKAEKEFLTDSLIAITAQAYINIHAENNGSANGRLSQGASALGKNSLTIMHDIRMGLVEVKSSNCFKIKTGNEDSSFVMQASRKNIIAYKFNATIPAVSQIGDRGFRELMKVSDALGVFHKETPDTFDGRGKSDRIQKDQEQRLGWSLINIFEEIVFPSGQQSLPDKQ